jgi:ribosomal protein S18 acetylase RimI-like enzyme
MMLSLVLLMMILMIDGYQYIPINQKSKTRLNLVSLSEYIIPSSIDITNSQWDYHLLERNDVNEAVEATIKTFYKPRLILNMNGMTGIEKMFWTSVINSFQSLDKGDYYNNVFLGFITRSGKRLQNPSLEISPDSLILVATVKGTREIAGLVEILLEKPEGNIAPSVQFFKFPVSDTDEPYLCNLCVLPEYRRKGLGTTLCSICEYIVQNQWKRNKMYLHVEDNNDAALAMYLRMSYTLTPGLSKLQSKLLGMDRIQYYKKILNNNLTIYQNEEDDKNDDDNFFSGLLSKIDSEIASNIMKSSGRF